MKPRYHGKNMQCVNYVHKWLPNINTSHFGKKCRLLMAECYRGCDAHNVERQASISKSELTNTKMLVLSLT